MDDHGILDVLLPHVRFLQQRIRAGLAGEGKAALAVLQQGDKGHGGDGLPAQLRTGGLHVVFGKGIHQEASKVIVAHLAAHGSAQPVLGHGDGHVGRRAARLAYVAGRFAARYEVDEHLANAVQIHHMSAPLIVNNVESELYMLIILILGGIVNIEER